MEQTLKLNVPLSFTQLIEVVRQLPIREKQQLIDVLQEDAEQETSKKEILENLASDYSALRNGTLKTRPLKDVLNEL